MKRTSTANEKINDLRSGNRFWIIHPSIHPSGVTAGWQGEFANCHRGLTLFRQVMALQRRFSGSDLRCELKKTTAWSENLSNSRQTPVSHMLSAEVPVIHDINHEIWPPNQGRLYNLTCLIYGTKKVWYNQYLS